MAKLFAMLCLVLLAAQPAIVAQWPPVPISHDDQLALTATVQAKQPHRIVARLTNRSTHDILLPNPTLNCGDARNGTIIIAAMVLKPVRDLGGRGCFTENFLPAIPVERRIEAWHRLPPGKSVEFSDELPAKARLATQPAEITYTARYTPPVLRQADLELLRGAHIQVPENELSLPWRFFRF